MQSQEKPAAKKLTPVQILREIWNQGEEHGLDRGTISGMLEEHLSERIRVLQRLMAASGPQAALEAVAEECREACVPVSTERLRLLSAAISRDENGALLRAKFGGGDPAESIKAMESKALTVARSEPFRLGVTKLDKAMGDGIYPGEILHIVGHEGGGKTALAISALENALWKTEAKVLMLEMDMPAGSVERLRLARLIGVSPREVDRMAAEESRDYVESKRVLASLGGPDRLAIYEGPRTLKDVDTILRYEIPSLVLLDYVTAVDGDMGGQDFQGDNHCARTVARQVRRWRDEWGIAFVLLSQVGRESKREAKKGSAGGHGMGSAALEQLADAEIELYCDVALEDGAPPRRIATVTKCRNAPAGRSFELEFEGRTRTFTGRSRETVREGKAREPLYVPTLGDAF